MRKARSWRPFLIKKRKFSENKNGWLTWEDSNFHIPISKNAFEMSTEFTPFWPKFDLETFAAASCGSEQARQPVKTSAPADKIV
jgi:hypothetical protein